MLDRLRRRLVVLHLRRPLAPWLLLATFALGSVMSGLDREGGVLVWFGTAGLLGVWVLRQRSGWIWRLPVAMGIAVGVALPWLSQSYNSDVLPFVAWHVPVVLAVGLMVQRGVAWGRPGSGRPCQFSIRGLLIATTVVAIGAVLIRVLGPYGQAGPILVAWSAIPVAADRWDRAGWPPRRLIAGVMGVTLLLSLLLGLLLGAGWFLGTLVQGVVIAAWLLGLRVTLRDVSPKKSVASRRRQPPETTTESAAG